MESITTFIKGDAVEINCADYNGYGIIHEADLFGGSAHIVMIETGALFTVHYTNLKLNKEPIENGTRVVLYRDVDARTESGIGFNAVELIGDTGIVLEKHADGFCKVLSSDFEWEYLIHERFLMKVNVKLHDLCYYCKGEKLFFKKGNTAPGKDIDWFREFDRRVGMECEIINVSIQSKDYPSYFVKFEDGYLTSVYQGWLSEEKPAREECTTITMECGTQQALKKIVTENDYRYVIDGPVRMFETGAVRSVEDGKPRFDLISPYAEKWLAEELARNIGSYGAGNYLLGIPEPACIGSLKRHLNTVEIGIKTNNQEMMDEAVNILCNAMFLCHTIQLKKLGLYNVSENFKRLVDGESGESKAA